MQIRETENGVVIRVKVTPNSSRSALLPGPEGLLAVKLTSPPVEGKANKELIKFLAKRIRIAPSAIAIIKGQSSREKTLLISGVDEKTVREILERALSEP
jgi:uncharacterized protein (TIGR00251 family)